MKNYKRNLMKWNLERYNTTPMNYQKFQILLLMENANTHLVSKFKDYLLFDDMTEFFKEYYTSKEIYSRLKTIYDYYESSSYLFPNYTAINEGKYIYKNIIKKQQLIDYLEDLEDKMKEKEEKRKNNSEESSCSEVFDSHIYDNIRKETGNDSKINELFCVGTKENSDCDSISSIIKLTEILKSKNKEKKVEKRENITNNSISNNINNRNNNITLSKDNNNNINNISSGVETKIFVSRKLNNNSITNNKRYINNFISKNNNTSSNLISRKININNIIKNVNNINKTSDFLKNKNESKKVINSYKKNGYKKNNIIINIINNNKNNNYHSNYNNILNHNTTNENNHFILGNNFIYNYNRTNENKSNNLNTHNISKSNSSKSNKNIKIKRKYIKANNNIVKDKIITKGLISKITCNNNRKNIIKRQNKDIKSKLLTFRLTTEQGESMVRNLTERMKNQSQSNSIKMNKVKSKIKNIISPYQKKRTKTEICNTKSDIFLFGHQNEINKSINRQILKNINLTNTSKHKKEISLINKKIMKYHFNINNNSKIKRKYIKHSSTNSQNLTKIGNKTSLLQIKDISNKKGSLLSFNKTQITSRNNSKEKINTIIRKNYKESLSPKKSQEIIYNKINKMKNKSENFMISSFLKSVNSNRKIKNLKIKKKYNNINYKSVYLNSNVKDIYSNIKNNKNRK